jgi:hypothetical protein
MGCELYLNNASTLKKPEKMGGTLRDFLISQESVSGGLEEKEWRLVFSTVGSLEIHFPEENENKVHRILHQSSHFIMCHFGCQNP